MTAQDEISWNLDEATLSSNKKGCSDEHPS